jgi:ABC-type iron transport system FetAB ATPase subunit
MTLKVQNISKTFDGKQFIFQNLSLELGPGDFFFMKGKSGCGKTLFLKSLCLLTGVQEGRFYWNGKELEGPDLPLFRSQVHFLNQFPSPFHGTALDYIKAPFSFSLHKVKKFERDVLYSFLEALHLSKEFLKKKVPHLSGGEKQLLKLMRSLLLSPKGLLLDEPTSNMDDEMKQRAEDLIFKVYKEKNCFLLWVTHDGAQIKRYAKNYLNFPSLQLEEVL